MAKQAKMKRGSIGKKALAAILAASMVLSSSAFSVLAAGVTIPGEGDGDVVVGEAAPVSYDDEVAPALNIADGVWYGWDVDGDKVEDTQDPVYTYDGLEHRPKVLLRWNGIPQGGTNGYLVEGRDYRLEYGRNVDAGEADNSRGLYYEPASGPYVHVIFTDSWTAQYGGGQRNLYLPFSIDQLDLSTVGNENIKVTWDPTEGWIYDGKEHYPSDIAVTVNGNVMHLTQDDYKMYPVDKDGNRILCNGDDNIDATWNPDTSAYLKEFSWTYTEKHGIEGQRNFKGFVIPDKQVDFHIQQKPLDETDLDVEIRKNIVYQSSATMTSDDIVLKVTDKLRADDDPKRVLKEGVDYTVSFLDETGRSYSKPVHAVGKYKVVITTTGTQDFRKDSLTYDYEVVNRRTLQMAVDTYWGVVDENSIVSGNPNGNPPYYTQYAYERGNDGDAVYGNLLAYSVGTNKVTYNGTDQFPFDDAHTLVIGNRNPNRAAVDGGGAQDPDHGNGQTGVEQASQLIENSDFTVVSNIGEWIDADTYKIELKGVRGTLFDGDTATIEFKIQKRDINADGITLKAEQGHRYKTHKLSDVSVNATDAGLDEKVYECESANGNMAHYPNHAYELLENGKDYTYEKNADGTVTVTGQNNYTGTKSLTISEAEVEDPIQNGDREHKMVLSDSSITAEVVGTLKFDEKVKGYKLNSATDFKLVETNDDGEKGTLSVDDYEIVGYQQGRVVYCPESGIPKAGEAWVILRGKREFTGLRKVPVTIGGVTRFDERVVLKQPSGEKGLQPLLDDETGRVHWILKPNNLVPNIDYLTGADYLDPYRIVIMDADGNTVISYDYDPANKTMTNKKGSIENAGTYTVHAIPTDGRFEGDVTSTITVPGEDLNSEPIQVTIDAIPDQKYIGEQIKPAVTVSSSQSYIKLVEGTDYTVSYGTNVNVGSGSVTVTGIGAYSGSISRSFNIVKSDGYIKMKESQEQTLAKGVHIGDTDCSPIVYTYLKEGDKQVNDTTITFTMKSSDESVAKITDENTISYVAPGEAKITITPDSKNLTLAAIEVTVKVSTPVVHLTVSNKIYKKSKYITVTTNKVKGATRFEVQWSLKNLKNDTAGAKTKSLSPTTGKTKLYREKIKCNKAGKKYYVRVRAKVNGVWTNWSEVEKIKSRK